MSILPVPLTMRSWWNIRWVSVVPPLVQLLM